MELIIIRHGESLWNVENRFTGWTDVDLSAEGIKQARTAAGILQKSGYNFDIAYTSVLKRAIRTLHLILEDTDRLWIHEEKCWRLNERFYGALQGMDKHAASMQFGFGQVEKWRRGISDLPPKISKEDHRYPGHDLRYRALSHKQLPLSESLHDTLIRLLPYWKNNILKAIWQKKKVLIVSHGNTLRALAGYLMRLDEDQLTALEIPCGIPIKFDLDAHGFATASDKLL